MNTADLLLHLDVDDLTDYSPALYLWGPEMSQREFDIEVAAAPLQKGGRSYENTRITTRRVDERPDAKYWQFVKKEMRTFLCSNEEKYRALWMQIEVLQDKSTKTIIGVVSAFLGSMLGASATLLVGFVAVCFFAVIKVGKEAYCTYTAGEASQENPSK